MRLYKTIGRTLLILPIISFAVALPIAVRETPQVGGNAVPDAAITMAKRYVDKMESLWGMYFERLSGKRESDLEGLKGLLHYGPEELRSFPYGPRLTKSPSLDHYLAPTPALSKSPSLDHYLVSPEPSESPSLDHSVASTDSETGPSRSAASESGWSRTSSPMEKPEFKSFLSMANKFKLWRRISGPGTVRDAMNVAQRELQGLFDTGATMVRDFRNSLNVSPTPARDVRHPASGKGFMKSQEIGVA